MRRAAVALALLAGLVGATPAAAHVEVLPLQLTVRQSGELRIRVPAERNVATTAVRVTVPYQITVYSLGPVPPGWRARMLNDSQGRVRTLEFTGGSIPPQHYADFTVLGTPFQPGTATWKVLQTYADGITKPWTGAPEPPGTTSPETGPSQPGPAAAQTIAAPGAAAPAARTPTASKNDGGSGAGVWLGVIAIGISLLALLATGFLWSTRPATLPSDEEDHA